MNVLLVHVDGKWPNLVLMKLSAHHKAQGDHVDLRKIRKVSLGFFDLKPNIVYISCIFSWNEPLARKILDYLSKGATIRIGGPGIGQFNIERLPDHIEHLMPDYSLYGIDYSMGFTSRGCPRVCPFCLVPKLEGNIRDHAPISEFHHPKHEKIILLDNNFLASPKWKENLWYILGHKLAVNFSQGLDIRLVNDYNANLLAHTRFMGPSFKKRRLHFAFDDSATEQSVRRGVETLKTHGVSPDYLMFYMLCGYKEPYNFEDDMYRFKVLRELGTHPYVMRYNYRRDIPILNHFARWVNYRVYKKCEFNEYKPAKKVLAS